MTGNEHLEFANHELRTALTSLRSNTELIRIELRSADDASAARTTVTAYLVEVENAVDRLVRLADEIRVWHATNKSTREQASA